MKAARKKVRRKSKWQAWIVAPLVRLGKLPKPWNIVAIVAFCVLAVCVAYIAISTVIFAIFLVLPLIIGVKMLASGGGSSMSDYDKFVEENDPRGEIHSRGMHF